MENHRDDLVVILAGYKDRMDTVLRVQSRDELADRAPLDFPDYSLDELVARSAS
jgi:hypothetical protein